MKLSLAIDRAVIGSESSSGLTNWMWRMVKGLLELFIPMR
jgi:hypothetical protein